VFIYLRPTILNVKRNDSNISFLRAAYLAAFHESEQWHGSQVRNRRSTDTLPPPSQSLFVSTRSSTKSPLSFVDEDVSKNRKINMFVESGSKDGDERCRDDEVDSND